MKLNDLLLSVVIGIVLISLMCIWLVPSLQDFMAGNSMWNGVRDFNRDFRVKEISSTDGLPSPVQGATVIVIPYLSYSEQEVAQLKDFVSNGGTLLLMDDAGFGNTILTGFGVKARFSGKKLLDPLFCYKNQNLPRITDFTDDVVKAGIAAVSLNYGTALLNIEPAQKLAWSSTYSYLDNDDNNNKNTKDTPGPCTVAAALSFGKGTILLVSDPSLIINSMIGKDNNLEFVSYLIQHYGNTDDITFDDIHLSKKPIDISKNKLAALRDTLSAPQFIVLIAAGLIVMVYLYMFKKGEKIGPKQ